MLEAAGAAASDLDELEAELPRQLVEIDARWRAAAAETTTLRVKLAAADVEVSQLALVWLPVAPRPDGR